MLFHLVLIPLLANLFCPTSIKGFCSSSNSNYYLFLILSTLLLICLLLLEIFLQVFYHNSRYEKKDSLCSEHATFFLKVDLLKVFSVIGALVVANNIGLYLAFISMHLLLSVFIVFDYFFNEGDLTYKNNSVDNAN